MDRQARLAPFDIPNPRRGYPTTLQEMRTADNGDRQTEQLLGVAASQPRGSDTGAAISSLVGLRRAPAGVLKAPPIQLTVLQSNRVALRTFR